jgi:hypothetical protein
VLEEETGGFGSVRDPELSVDGCKVELHRVHREAEALRDLIVAQSLRDRLEYLGLARSQHAGRRPTHRDHSKAEPTRSLQPFEQLFPYPYPSG